jgi:hypothetical protein
LSLADEVAVRATVMGDPNYALFRGVEITTLIVALLFTIVRLINRVYRKTLSLVSATWACRIHVVHVF